MTHYCDDGRCMKCAYCLEHYKGMSKQRPHEDPNCGNPERFTQPFCHDCYEFDLWWSARRGDR